MSEGGRGGKKVDERGCKKVHERVSEGGVRGCEE